MAYPFGGHPRLEDYIAWAMETHGCLMKSGVSVVDGRSETFVLIECPSTSRHVHLFAGFKEYLTPSQVSYLDRRLSLDSPFPKIVSYD